MAAAPPTGNLREPPPPPFPLYIVREREGSRTLPWRKGQGCAPPLPGPIYSGGFGAAIDMRTSLSWRSPTPLPPRLSQCLAKPCWSATLLHDHHAVMLLLDGVFPNLSLSPCWIKARETSPGCMCVERGGTVVRCLDRIRPRTESLRVRLHRPRSCNASASRSSRV